MKLTHQVVAMSLINLLCINVYALPLNISVMRGRSLPTQFIVGGGSNRNAFYIVSNQTNGVRANNYVAHLPPSVSHITTDNSVANLCGNRFTLQPKGQSGDNCVLELTVAGTVNSKDPRRTNHLFVCLQDQTTCVGPPDQINVSGVAAVIVGSFTTNSFSSLPYLITTRANQAWRFVDVRNIANMPKFAPLVNSLLTTNCSGNTCIAGGIYSRNSGDQIPLLVTSQNQGQSWNYINTEDVGGPNFGAINNILNTSCSSSACIVDGSYQNTQQTSTFHLLLTSQDQAKTWSFINVANVGNAPNFTALGNQFFGGNCTGATCLVVGTYGTGTSSGGTSRSNITSNPLLLVSTDNGTSFRSVDIAAIPGIPTFSNISSNQLNASSCNNAVCVAVGSYSDANNAYVLPLLLRSNSQGQQWTYIDPDIISNIPAGAFVGNNILKDVSCSANLCVAVGYYSVPNTGNVFPLLLVSDNNAQSWRFIDTTTLPGIPSYGSFNLLYAASCSGTTCSVSGSYATNSSTPDTLPLLFQSNNGGQTWAYINTTTSTGAPAFGDYNNFLDTICFGNNVCATVGEYLATVQRPLIFLTNAANNNAIGSVWSSLPAASISNNPAILAGSLNEITVTS